MSSSSNIIIIAFHLHDWMIWNNNSARVPWTKLESAYILFKRRRQGNMGSLLDQQLCKWEPLKIFIVIFSSLWLDKRKGNSEKHTEMFLEFLIFRKQANIKGKSKNEKNYLHGKAPNKQKKNKEIFLDFLFSAIANYSRKKNLKEAWNIFWIFSKFFKHTKRKRENQFNMDNTMKKCGHRQLEWNVWTWM